MTESGYITTIGLEVHAELKTNSKVFCGCKNSYGDEENTNCCEVCIGSPGALPVLNKKAVELCIKAGLTVNCSINNTAVFERKNYFYPDLSKAYQISQLVSPICINGKVKLKSGKEILINRIHLEEDAGKLIHYGGKTGSIVDYNRGGVPLIELVTDLPPLGRQCMETKEEAIEFLNILRNNYIYANVAECKMEQGGMRCDVNVSVRKKEAKEYGTRTEMKNLNSFKAVERAIEYETKRQIKILENGGKITQETRRWDDDAGISILMRSKEDAEDYRYFPDPDLLAVEISEEVISKIKSEMPMLPEKLKEVMLTNGLSEYEAHVLLSDNETANYYLSLIKQFNNYKAVSSWVLNDLAGIKKSEKITVNPVAEYFVYIMKLTDEKKITRSIGVELLKELIINNRNPEDLVKERKLLEGISDTVIMEIIKKVITEKPNLVSDYKENPNKVSPFIIGQVMKATQGKANSSVVINLIEKLINN